MGPLGVPELIFIFVLALLIFGPRKLPEIGRTLGRGLAEFRKASNELKRSLNTEIVRDVKDIHDEIRDHHPRRILASAIEDTPEREEPAPEEPESDESEKSDESDESDVKTPDGTVARSATAAAEDDPTSAGASEDAAADDSQPGVSP